MFIFVDLSSGHTLHVHISMNMVCPQEALKVFEKCENASPFVFP